MKVNIETSCGKIFEQDVSELPDDELRVLLYENAGRPDVDPAELAALRAEFHRRSDQGETASPTRCYCTATTHRDLFKEALGDVMYKSIGGSPWTYDVEDAIVAFKAKLDEAIEAVPIIAEILDKPVPRDSSDGETIPF
jgi:hypothetical protein